MASLNKICVKFFADKAQVENHEFIPVMQGWIRDRSLPGILIDAVDYGHVKQGPGVLLACHDENYAMDRAGNRLGLLYQRKTAMSGSDADKIEAALLTAKKASALLAKSFSGRLTFRDDEVEISVNDRLAWPNTDESLNALRTEIESAAAKHFAGKKITIERISLDQRERFSVRIKSLT